MRDFEAKGDDDQRERSYPLTAREALWAIRHDIAQLHVDSDLDHAVERIDRQAADGLNQTAPPNFELTDELADRLANAHEILRTLKLGTSEEIEISYGRIAEALALPPGLEAMVERRIGPER